MRFSLVLMILAALLASKASDSVAISNCGPAVFTPDRGEVEAVGSQTLDAGVESLSVLSQQPTDFALRLMAIEARADARVQRLGRTLNLSTQQSQVEFRALIQHERDSRQLRQEIPQMAVTMSPLQREIFETIMAPVLRNRIRYVRILPSSRASAVRFASPLGQYEVSLDSRLPEEVERKPVRLEFVQNEGPWLLGQAQISTQSRNKRGRFRQLLRADPYLHEGQTPPSLWGLDLPVIPNTLQEQTVEELWKIREAKRLQMVAGHEPSGVIKLGLMMTTGLGKSVVAAQLIKRIEEGLGRDQKVIVVLEDRAILRQIGKSLSRDLEIAPHQIAHLYESETTSPKTSPRRDARVILVSRTTYMNRASTFEQIIRSEKSAKDGKSIFYLFDELQHLGREGGQFAKILLDCERQLTINDTIFMMSATPWHTESNIVKEHLPGQMYGPLLDQAQLLQLNQGENLPELARVQWFRSVIEGWSSPLEDVEAVRYLGEEPVNSFIRRPRREADGTVRTIIHTPLYDDMAKRIVNLSIPGVPTRAVIFETSIERARQARNLLAQALPQFETRLISSLEPSKDNFAAIDWMADRDREAHDIQMPKLLSSVNMALEGIDMPPVNLAVITRNIDSLHTVFQIVGRTSRLAQFKLFARAIDYSGKLSQLFADSSLWEQVHINLQEAQQLPSLRETVFNEQIVDAKLLVGERIETYPKMAAMHEARHTFSDLSDEQVKAFQKCVAVLQLEFPSYFKVTQGEKSYVITDIDITGVMMALTNAFEGDLQKRVHDAMMAALHQHVSVKNDQLDLTGALYETLYAAAEVWNELSTADRLGFEPVELKDLTTATTFDRLLSGLVPFRIPAPLYKIVESETQRDEHRKRVKQHSTRGKSYFAEISQIFEQDGFALQGLPPDIVARVQKDYQDFRRNRPASTIAAWSDALTWIKVNWVIRKVKTLQKQYKPIDLNGLYDLKPNLDYLPSQYTEVSMAHALVKALDQYVKQAVKGRPRP